MSVEVIKLVLELAGVTFSGLLLIIGGIFTFMSFTGRVGKDETVMPGKLRIPAFIFGLLFIAGAFGTFFYVINFLGNSLAGPSASTVPSLSPTTVQDQSTNSLISTATNASTLAPTQTNPVEPLMTPSYEPTTTIIAAKQVENTITSGQVPQPRAVVQQPQPQLQPTQAPQPTQALIEPTQTQQPTQPPIPPTQAPQPTAAAPKYNSALFIRGEPYLGCDRVNESWGNYNTADVLVESKMFIDGKTDPISSDNATLKYSMYSNLGFNPPYVGNIHGYFRFMDTTTHQQVGYFEFSDTVNCP